MLEEGVFPDDWKKSNVVPIHRKDSYLHTILLPSYLQTYYNAVSEGAYLTSSTTQNKIKPIPARAKVFENSFFPYCIKEWSKLNDKIRNIESINKFKVTILNFIRPKANSVLIYMIPMELSY